MQHTLKANRAVLLISLLSGFMLMGCQHFANNQTSITQTVATPTKGSTTPNIEESDDRDETTLSGRGLVPYLPVGLVLGSSLGDNGGFVLGMEASLVLFEDTDAYWFGLVTDGLYDFGQSATRLSAGLEFGYWIFGIETSYAHVLAEENNGSGLRFGLVASFGLLSVYGRYTRLFNDDSTQFGELGALLKFPIPL